MVRYIVGLRFKYKLLYIFGFGIFMVIFLRHDGYIYLCFIACCETDSGLKVLENDVG